MQNKSVSCKYGHSNFSPNYWGNKVNSRENTSKKHAPLCDRRRNDCDSFVWALACETICLNKWQVVTSHLWTSLGPIPIYWSLGSRDGSSSSEASWKPMAVFSKYREEGSCLSNWEAKRGFGGQGNYGMRKWNAKTPSLEPSSGSHKWAETVFYSFNIQCMQNCVTWEEIATLLEALLRFFTISENCIPYSNTASSFQ